MSEGLTQGLKYHAPRAAGRQQQDVVPSGHAADTFAFATALERHRLEGAVPAYMFASYVAISRLPANRHWLSDAVFGSAVGIIAGRTVTRHGREFPVAVAVVPGGAEIMFSRFLQIGRPGRPVCPGAVGAQRRRLQGRMGETGALQARTGSGLKTGTAAPIAPRLGSRTSGCYFLTGLPAASSSMVSDFPAFVFTRPS